MTIRLISPSECSEFISGLLKQMGASATAAYRWAEFLVETSLLGFDTHGIRILDRYVKQIQNGGIDLKAEPLIMDDRGACVRMDGQAGLGHLAADQAARMATERAADYGISCITVRNCNHIGACGLYARTIASHDQIGICAVVSRAGIAPWGGKDAMVGLNAIAVGAPIESKPDFLLDIAMSRTAMGRITKAQDLGESISDRWALDANGNPTTDPNQAKIGSLLPIGEHKGYGLAMAIEMMTVLLSGGEFGYNIRNWTQQPDDSMGQSFLVIAIDIQHFGEVDVFKDRFQAWVDLLTSSSVRDGFECIYYPGELANRTRLRRTTEGIPIDDHTWNMLNQLAEEFKIRVPYQM